MVLGRLFGGSGSGAAHRDASVAQGPGDPDTAALRRIVAQLDSLPVEQRKFVAGFAYILGRVANADLAIVPEEVGLMERTVMEVSGLPEAEAVLVVQIALEHEALYGGTEDFAITREFARTSTPEQLQRLLHCAFAVGAADQTIDAQESSVLDEIGRELGFTDAEIRQVRAEFKDSFQAVREVRKALAVEGTPEASGAPAGSGTSPGSGAPTFSDSPVGQGEAVGE